MPRRPSLPTYTHHKSSGQARVRTNGRDLYLGPYGSPKSNEAFAQLLLDLACQQTASAAPRQDDVESYLQINLIPKPH
jgi:hypothetical protein